jgi:hypothetical protein
MRHFLVEARTDSGDYTFIVESARNTDLTLEVYDGEEPTDRERAILDEIEIMYDPENCLDQVRITELDKIERSYTTIEV